MSDAVEMRGISRAIARRWLFVIPVAVLSAGLGFVATEQLDPVYEATTTVLAGRNVDPANVDDSDASKRLTLTLAALVRGRPVMVATVRELGLDRTPEQLRADVSVKVVPDTQVMVLTVQADSPETAERIAGEVAEQFIAFSAQVTPLDQVVVEPANAKETKVAPDPAFNTILAGALGFVLASALALFREFRPGRGNRRQPGLLGEARELGIVRGADRLITLADPGSADTEAYGAVYSNLNVALGDRPGQVVLLVGPTVRDQRSIVAANLAIMSALAGSNPVLVDAGLRQSTQHRLFWLRASPGLGDFLAEPAQPFAEVVRDTPFKGLRLVTAGSPGQGPAILLSPPNLARLAHELAGLGSLVMIDCPLDGNPAETILLARQADAVVVVGSKRADAGLSREARDGLEQAGVEVTGILSVVPRRLDRLRRPFRRRGRAAKESMSWLPESKGRLPDSTGRRPAAPDGTSARPAPDATPAGNGAKRPERLAGPARATGAPAQRRRSSS